MVSLYSTFLSSSCHLQIRLNECFEPNLSVQQHPCLDFNLNIIHFLESHFCSNPFISFPSSVHGKYRLSMFLRHDLCPLSLQFTFYKNTIRLKLYKQYIKQYQGILGMSQTTVPYIQMGKQHKVSQYNTMLGPHVPPEQLQGTLALIPQVSGTLLEG